MSTWVHHEKCTSMKVEYCHVAFHFGHEFRIVLAFGKVGPLTKIINVGAITGPLCLDHSHGSTRVFLARFS